MSDLYDQEVRDAVREVQVRFAVSAREKARRELAEVLLLAREALTLSEIAEIVEETLGDA